MTSGRVAVVGSVSLDRIVRAGRSESRLGGVVTYAGLAYRRLGLETVVATNLRAADRPHLAPLQAQGIALNLGASPATTVCVNHLDGDHRRQEMPARARTIGLPDALAALGGARLVHLGPLHEADVDPAVAEAAAAAGARVALDVQGLVRRIEGTRVGTGLAATAERFLAAARVIKGDAAELEILAHGLGLTPPELAARFLVEEMIATDGKNGGRVHLGSGQIVTYDGIAVGGDNTDPTGAGDVFLAAYLVARIIRSEGPEAAARAAATIAAQQVAGSFIGREELALPG